MKDYFNTVVTYNRLLNENRIVFLQGMSILRLPSLIDLYKKTFPSRTLVLFLDYIQIIDIESNQTGWEKVKEIAYCLEKLAINQEIIIIAGSQVNENRQVREGRDIYNAATTVLDIMNHSHEALLYHKEHKNEYKPKIANKSVCTFAATKQKHGEAFTLKEYLLFNGFFFEEKNKGTTPNNFNF